MADAAIREELLTRVLTEPHHCGVMVVLSAKNLNRLETSRRYDFAKRFHCCPVEQVGSTRHTQDEAIVLLHNHSPDIPLTIVTSAAHQLRAFLTFVHVLKQPWDRLIYNQPCPSDAVQVREELEKISKYQAAGQVASFADGLAYLQWRDGA